MCIDSKWNWNWNCAHITAKYAWTNRMPGDTQCMCRERNGAQTIRNLKTPFTTWMFFRLSVFFSSFYFSVPDSDHASGWMVGLLAITCISITILACTCCHRSKSGFEVSCQNCIPFCSHLKFNTDQNNKWKIKPNKSRTKNPRKQTNKTFLVSKSLAITL